MKKWAFAIIALVVIGLWAGLGIPFILNHTPDNYAGQEVFYSEGDYKDFKLAITEAHGRLERTATLSSEPPIIVKFSLYVPHDTFFSYGHREPPIGLVPIVLFSLALLGVLTIALTIIYSSSVRSSEE